MTRNQVASVQLSTEAVPEINKEEFKISSKCLGCGQQGKVYMGKYGDKDVAIKTIRIFSKNTKDIEREISVLKSIKHENFIEL